VSPRGSVDERYPVKVANAIRALEACKARLDELGPVLDAQRAAVAEAHECVRQAQAIVDIMLKFHRGEVES